MRSTVMIMVVATGTVMGWPLGATETADAAKVRQYQQKCDEGLADACRQLANHFYDGVGVPQDKAKAAQLFRKACEGGNTKACFGLGYMYENGNGLTQDKVEALRFYQKACDGGHAATCDMVGLVYSTGSGTAIAKDKAKAAHLYQMACDGGDPTGCRHLADMYEKGDGVAQDKAQAARLYQKVRDANAVSTPPEVSTSLLENAVREAPRDPQAHLALADARFLEADVRLRDPLAPPPPPLPAGVVVDARKEEAATRARRQAVEHYRGFLDALGEDREPINVRRWDALKNLLTLFTADPELPLAEGLRYAEAAEERFPKNAVLLMTAGRFYTARGRGVDAERLLRRSVAELSTPQNWEALAAAYIAPIWPDRPRIDQAMAVAEDCAARNPRFPAYQVSVARVAFACAFQGTGGDSSTRDAIVDRGLKAVDAALVLRPGDRDALATAGLLYRVKASLAVSPARRLQYLHKAVDFQSQARGDSRSPDHSSSGKSGASSPGPN